MKTSIDSETLIKSLARLRGTVGTISVDRLIRLDFEQGKMTMTASNSVMQSQVVIQGTGEGSASLCIDLADFLVIAKQSQKNSEILLEYEEGGIELIMTRDRGQSRFEVMGPEYTTIWSDIINGLTKEMDGAPLSSLLTRVLHCVTENADLKQLNCLFLSTMPNGGTRAVATDGHRMAKCEQEILKSDFPVTGLLLPPQTVKEIIRMTQDGGPITVTSGDNAASFAAGPETITTKLVEGSYIEYDRVMLFDAVHNVQLPRAPFLEAVLHMNAILTDKKLTTLVLNQDGGHLETRRDRLSSAESFTVEVYEGIPDTGFNAGYLADALRAFRGSEIAIEYSGSSSERIRLSDPDDDDFVQIIMPMKI